MHIYIYIYKSKYIQSFLYTTPLCLNSLPVLAAEQLVSFHSNPYLRLISPMISMRTLIIMIMLQSNHLKLSTHLLPIVHYLPLIFSLIKQPLEGRDLLALLVFCGVL